MCGSLCCIPELTQYYKFTILQLKKKNCFSNLKKVKLHDHKMAVWEKFENSMYYHNIVSRFPYFMMNFHCFKSPL